MRFQSTICIASLLLAVFITNAAMAQFKYISPVPGSTYHHPETNIILKNGGMIDVQSLNVDLISITGSTSGVYNCRVVLSDDGKTVVIYPLKKFSEGEQVIVNIADGFRKKNGEIISGTSFQFSIRPVYSPSDKASIRSALKYAKDIEFIDAGIPIDAPSNTVRDECEMPDYVITSTGNELKQDVFYYNFRGGDGCFGKSIISNEGDSIYATFDVERGIGFTLNRNGYLTYYNYVDSCFDMMDSSYNVVKQYFMGNGFRADEHEFLIFPDGHSFMMCYDIHPNLDLSDLGGLDTVDVIGCVIQELDADQNVIFQWRTWDYMLYTDAIAWTEDDIAQGLPVFDWVHGNSIEVDTDGNIMVSFRHLCEITKINLATGDIMWRMGGDINQFTFVSDPDAKHFSGQHHFRILDNGNYTLFNNGNNVTPNVSSAKEYQLDQVNKVATMVWKYQHPMVGTVNVFGPAMGSVQRLSNGNTFINWGLLANNINMNQAPRFSEVDASGNIVWEFNFTNEYYISYRALKFDWNPCAPVVDASFQLTFINTDSAVITWNQPNLNSSYIFQYKLIASANWISIPVITDMISLDNLQPESSYQWRVQSVCSSINDSSVYSSIQEFTTLSTAVSLISGEPVSILIYPNPADENLMISFSMNQSLPVTLSLTNFLGQERLKESWTSIFGINNRLLDIKQLPAGVYVLTLKSLYSESRKQIIIR
ncbi:MAG: aryl-sulfate sulfotransferase [Chitinophagales bacterium]